MEGKQFAEICQKLDKIIRLLATQNIGDKTGKEAIRVLSSAGFQPKEIAELIGTTSNTVSVALNSIRKKRVSKNAKKD